MANVTSVEAYEDKGGGLYVLAYHADGSKRMFTGFEYDAPGTLAETLLNAMKYGVNDWEGEIDSAMIESVCDNLVTNYIAVISSTSGGPVIALSELNAAGWRWYGEPKPE